MMKAHWLSWSCLWGEGQAVPWVSCMKRGGRGNRLTCSLEVQVLGCQQSCSIAEPLGQRHILQELSLLPEETNYMIIFPLSYSSSRWTFSWVTTTQPSVKCEAFQMMTRKSHNCWELEKHSIHILSPTYWHFSRKIQKKLDLTMYLFRAVKPSVENDGPDLFGLLVSTTISWAVTIRRSMDGGKSRVTS